MNIPNIIVTTNGMRIYTSKLIEKDCYRKYFDDMCDYIADAFCQWCGETYVGCAKDPKTEKIFQSFFESLAELVKAIYSHRDIVHPEELELAKSLIYRGDIYRYLGHWSPFDCKEIVEPQYSEIYVSWSKERGNSYLLSKLYGPITLVQGKIRDSEFGLDLEGFTEFYHNRVENKFMIARPNEHEVVFPTIEKNTIKIEYLYD